MANTVAIDVKINALEAAKSLKDLRAGLKDAVNELAGLESGTQEFNKLASAVDDAKDRIEKLNQDIEQVGGAGKFAALADFGSKIAAGFEVAQASMALFGNESEAIKQALEKVQAAMALTQGLKDLSEFGKSWASLKSVVSDFGKSAMAALQGMKAGIAATGIGVLLLAVGALVAYWDDIKGFFDSLSEGAEKTKALNETLGDFKKGAQDAFKEINDVKVAFQQAKDGVISKEQALKKYNDTLGPTLGLAKDLNEAEAIMVKKADAYIEAQARKQRANALLAKSAEQQTIALTADLEDQTTWYEKTASFYLKWNLGMSETADAVLKNSQERGAKNAKQDALRKQSILDEAAMNELKIADKKMKDFDIKEKQTNTNTKVNNEKKVDLDAELNKELAKLRQENIDDARKAELEKEKIDYEATRKEYETKYAGKKNLNKLLDELENKHLNAISEINNKFNKIENDKIDADNKKKLDAKIEGINNERKAIENQRKLTYEEQIVFENRIYEATISNTKLTLAEKEKLELEHKAKLKGLNDGFQAEIQAKQDQFNADEISIKETQIKTAQRLQQDTDQMELDAAELKNKTIQKDLRKSFAEKLAAQEEYDAKVAEIDKRDQERKKRNYDFTVQTTQSALQATADLIGAFAGKSKEQQKKAFEAQKAINIASAIISTYQNAVTAYQSQFLPIPDPSSPIRGAIAATVAVATGVANIRKIEQTKFDSKETPSGAGGGGAGGGSFAPNLSAPVSNTSTNLASIGFGQQQPEPVKVFVTETDITNSQKNIKSIEQKASIE